MIGRTAAALLLALAASPGCNLIVDSDELKGNEDLRCAGGVYQEDADLCWQDPRAEDPLEWWEAIGYCDALVLFGHDDWRLPSRQEIVDLLGGCDADVLSGGEGFCDSCAESETCSALIGSDAGWYWSSSPSDGDYAWIASFGYGSVNGYYVANGLSVRCVRSGP